MAATKGLPCKATHPTNLHIPQTILRLLTLKGNTILINHIPGLNIKYSKAIQIHHIVAVMAATVVTILVAQTVASLAKVRVTPLSQPNGGVVGISAIYLGLRLQEGEEVIPPSITSLAAP